MTQYKKIAEVYTSSGRTEHPQRKYMIYPNWLEACGDVTGKRILDLGCGGGYSSRMLAKKGATVIGVDKELKMIKIAQNIEQKNPMGITYIVADAENLPKFQKKFDLITPTFLLHYASTEEELKKIIKNIAINLKYGGRMVAINQNPEQPVLPYVNGASDSEEWAEKPFVEGSVVKVTLYEKDGSKICGFNNYFWQKQAYINIMKECGFCNIQWIKPKMNEIGRKVCADWKKLEKTSLIIISVTLKGGIVK